MQMQPRLLPRASLMYYIFLAWQEICVIFLGVELPIQELAVHHFHLTFLRRGAAPESIDALPTWKFKLKKNRDVDDQKVNSGAPKLRPQPSCRLGVCLCYSSGLWWNHFLYQTVGSWLSFFFTIGIVLGSYLAMMTVIFFWAAYKTDFFPWVFHVSTIEKITYDDLRKLASTIYLQVNTVSQAFIFVTRSWSWSCVEHPGLLLVEAFLVATLIAVHANWSLAAIEGIGWSWAGVIWLNNIIFYIPLDFIKFIILYALSGKA